MPDSPSLQLALDDDAPTSRRRPRVGRARAGERGEERRTSLLLRPSDERLLDALGDRFSEGETKPVGIGETIRRALRVAALEHGLSLDELEHDAVTGTHDQEAAAA